MCQDERQIELFPTPDLRCEVTGQLPGNTFHADQVWPWLRNNVFWLKAKHIVGQGEILKEYQLPEWDLVKNIFFNIDMIFFFQHYQLTCFSSSLSP